MTILLVNHGAHAELFQAVEKSRPRSSIYTKIRSRHSRYPADRHAIVHHVAISVFHSPVGRETEETHIVPKDDGAKSTRSIILLGDELKVSSPAPSAKGKSELVLRRSK